VIAAVEAGAIAPAEMDEVRPGIVDGLLTDPQGVVERALGAAAPAQSLMVRVLLLTILAGTAAFGAAVGFTRGGVQVLYAAIKLPLVVLVTAFVSTPALTALGLALGRQTELRRDLIRVLAALARGSLVLAALAPVMLVATCVQLAYSWAVLSLVGCCCVAGVAGLPLLGRARWSEALARRFLVVAMAVVVTVAGTHTAWLFRPYLVSPRSTDVPFVRPIEGSFSHAVDWHSRSALGLPGRGQP
jgi:hypothetical protein